MYKASAVSTLNPIATQIMTTKTHYDFGRKNQQTRKDKLHVAKAVSVGVEAGLAFDFKRLKYSEENDAAKTINICILKRFKRMRLAR